MSQKTRIRRALLRGGKVSQLSALREFQCMRLADVIYKLRGEGLRITTKWRKQKGKRYAVYYFEACDADEGHGHFRPVGGYGYCCSRCGISKAEIASGLNGVSEPPPVAA